MKFVKTSSAIFMKSSFTNHFLSLSMTCVIRVLQDGFLGLQLVGSGVVSTAKSFDYMCQLREPPQETDLMKCTKEMLINILSPSGRNRFSGWSKHLLASQIRAYWGNINITNDHVEYFNNTDVYGEIQCIFNFANGMWEEMAEQRREQRRQAEAVQPTLHDLFFFDGHHIVKKLFQIITLQGQ